MTDDRSARRRQRPKREADRPPEPEAEPAARGRRPRPEREPDDAALIADLRAAVELLEAEARPAPGRPPGAPPRATRPPLDNACISLIEIVRKRCPGLLPAAPLGAGAALDPLPILPKEVSSLLGVAARQAVLAAAGGRLPDDPERLPTSVLWQDGPAALLVEVGGLAVNLGDGLLSVAIPVRCDQLPRGRELVTVDFVLGTPGRPAGMLVAAAEPRGSRLVVGRWGEALTALAWQALLDAVGGVAGAAGVDEDGAVLVPTAMTASPNGLAVVSQARHAIDRERPGRVVRDAEHRGGGAR